MASSTAAAIALTINWYCFVWAVTNDRVAESSLGYFLSPLTSLAFAVILEKESLRPLQWTGFSLAAFTLIGCGCAVYGYDRYRNHKYRAVIYHN